MTTRIDRAAPALLMALVAACRTAAHPVPSLESTPASATARAPASGAPEGPPSGAQPAPTAGSPLVQTRTTISSESFSPVRSEAALRAFVPDVPFDETGGECTLVRSGGSGATTVTAYFPARANVKSSVTVIFDSTGRAVRYNELRGGVRSFRFPPGTTQAQRDSAFRAAGQAERTTTVQLDWAIDQALLVNRGGGKPTAAVIGYVRQVERLESLGRPSDRLERIRRLCGV